MQHKTIDNKTIVRIDKGEELIHSLTTICQQAHIQTGSITGIGATNQVTLGLFNTQTNRYHSQTLTGDHEITALIGNITTHNNHPYLHLHITLCNTQNQALSGHLTNAIISVTFEGIIDHINTKITRTKDPQTGLNILDI